MTKTVRCDFTGNELDEDEARLVAITYRDNQNKLMKLELDADPAWLTKNILEPAAGLRNGRPLKWMRWENATQEEKAKDPKSKGHWEKVT